MPRSALRPYLDALLERDEIIHSFAQVPSGSPLQEPKVRRLTTILSASIDPGASHAETRTAVMARVAEADVEVTKGLCAGGDQRPAAGKRVALAVARN
jgi:hypothetical protein